MVKLSQQTRRFTLKSIFKEFFMTLKDLISLFCYAAYIRVIPRSWFTMDGLRTDLEATVVAYNLRSYGGEQ